MAAASNRVALPRRVVTLYLLFSLLAVTSLLAGAYYATQAILLNRTTGSALSQAGRLAAAIQLDRVQTQGSNTQELLSAALTSGQFVDAAVIDEMGVYTSHTIPEMVGAVAGEPEGAEPFTWGTVEGRRYPRGDGGWIDEYRVPLIAPGFAPNELRLTHPEPHPLDTLAQCGQYATVAILGPLCIVGIGVWIISRQVNPLSEIDHQLTAIAKEPHGSVPRIQSTTPNGLASIGWNRLSDHLNVHAGTLNEESLECRLESLAESTQQNRATTALDSLADGFVLTDEQGRVEIANTAVTTLLQADSEIEGRELVDLLANLNEDIVEQLSGCRSDASVTELQVSCGEENRVLRVARGRVRGGAEDGHVWSIRDVTQQKLAEASRDQFINTATHELRTPLANIKAYAEALTTCDFTDVEEQKLFCNTIDQEATRLARFVDDLLSISSMEVGSIAVDRKMTNVQRLLEEAADKVRTLMKSSDLDFSVQLGEKLGEALIDKDKVLGMVVNLLGNAAKYTPHGGTVTYSAIRNEDSIYIEVADDGVGIAEEEQSRVFEKFYRSENPDVRDEVGTGLGLPLAREIAELHRGELTLSSTLGEGSTFTVVLPTQ